MLEILLLWQLCRDLGRNLRSKDINPLWYQVRLIFAWFVGEFLGGVVAAALFPHSRFTGYVMGLGFGLGFALLVFFHARSIRNRRVPVEPRPTGGFPVLPPKPIEPAKADPSDRSEVP